MPPHFVILQEPIVPNRSLNLTGGNIHKRQTRGYSPNTVRSLRSNAGLSGTRAMVPPPESMFRQGIPGIKELSKERVMDATSYGRTKVSPPSWEDCGDDISVTSEVTANTLEAGGMTEASANSPIAGHRKALDFAMQGLGGGGGVAGKRAGGGGGGGGRGGDQNLTVVERLRRNHEQKEQEKMWAKAEAVRRHAAKKKKAAHGSASSEAAQTAATAPPAQNKARAHPTAAQTSSKAQADTAGPVDTSMMGKLADFITRPNALNASRKDREPNRLALPTPPRTASVGKVGGRVALPRGGETSYALVQQSNSFYDRAFAVATAERRPLNEEEANARQAKDAAKDAKEKGRASFSSASRAEETEGKQTNTANMKKLASAFAFANFDDGSKSLAEALRADDEEKKAREEGMAAGRAGEGGGAAAQGTDNRDYMKRRREELDHQLGKALAPLYRSDTRLVFDKGDRAVLQAFVYSGKGGPLKALGQGLLAGSDDGGGNDHHQNSPSSQSLSHSSSSSSSGPLGSRWDCSSHGSTANVLKDLVKLTKRAERANKEVVEALEREGVTLQGAKTTAAAIKAASVMGLPATKGKAKAKTKTSRDHNHGEEDEGDEETEGVFLAQGDGDAVRIDDGGGGGSSSSIGGGGGGVGVSRTLDSARSVSSEFSALTGHSQHNRTKGVVPKRRVSWRYHGSGDGSGGGENDEDDGVGDDGDGGGGGACFGAVEASTENWEGAERQGSAGEADEEEELELEMQKTQQQPMQRSGRDGNSSSSSSSKMAEKEGRGGGGGADLSHFSGGAWDPSMAVCSRKGCQGCAYHRLKSRSVKDWPGPGQYTFSALGEGLGGGRFSSANPKTNLEWVEYFESQKPGPADYPDRSGEKVTGGRFNSSKSKTSLEWVEYYAAQRPGPTDHGDVGGAYKLTTSKHGGTGPKFSLANPKSELDWKIHEHSHFPGPGGHGDCGPKALSRLGRVRETSSLGTFGVEDCHPQRKPPAAHMPASLRVPGRGRWLPDA